MRWEGICWIRFGCIVLLCEYRNAFLWEWGMRIGLGGLWSIFVRVFSCCSRANETKSSVRLHSSDGLHYHSTSETDPHLIFTTCLEPPLSWTQNSDVCRISDISISAYLRTSPSSSISGNGPNGSAGGGNGGGDVNAEMGNQDVCLGALRFVPNLESMVSGQVPR